MERHASRPKAVGDALARLAAELAGVAQDVEASARARCPHRGVRSRCAYPGACRNQAALPHGGQVCSGDAQVRFAPETP